jgi:hypothetical protein
VPSTFPPKTVTARRDYTCAECGEAIPAGLPYLSQVTIDRLVITTRRTHTLCTQTLPGDPFS